MKWTEIKPNRSGWWWIKHGMFGRIPVWVYESCGKLYVGRYAVDGLGGAQWSSQPIKEPVE